MKSSTNASRRFTWAALLILLGGFALRTWGLGHANLSGDELITRQRAESSLQDNWGSVAGSGDQLPLYFFAMSLFPVGDDFSLRYPSTLAGMIALALLIRIAGELYADRRLALWAGMLLALNALHIATSRAARPYAWLIALALATSLLFLRSLRGRSSRASYTISSAAAYLTHFSSLALPAAQFAVLIAARRRDRRRWPSWWKVQIVAGLPLVLWALPLVAILALSDGGLLSGTGSSAPRPMWLDPLYTGWDLAVGYHHRVPVGIALPGLIVVTAGLALAGVTMRRRENPPKQGAASSAPTKTGTDDIRLYWLTLALLPVLGVFALSQFRPTYLDRYFLVALPAVILLILTGWRSVTRCWMIPALIMTLTAGGITLWTFHDSHFSGLDWRGAAAYVQQGQQPGDVLLVDGDLSYDLIALYAPPGTITRFTTLDDLPTVPATRLWVVYVNPHGSVHTLNNPTFDPFEPGLATLGDWLHAHRDQVIEHRQFLGIQVVLVRGGS